MEHFDAEVRDTPERVFARLADLRAYGDWLPGSANYRGTHEISPGPVAVGTTYVEPDPFGTREGEVTELDAPRRLAFVQTMLMRPAFLGWIGIELAYELTPHADHVHVRRTVVFTPRGSTKFAWPVIRRLFRRENARIMRALGDSG